MTLTELRALLARCSYKPGYRLSIIAPTSFVQDTPMLQVQYETQDTYDAEHTIPLVFQFALPYASWFGEEDEMLAIIQHAIERMEVHESQEWFRVDGAIRTNPHEEKV